MPDGKICNSRNEDLNKKLPKFNGLQPEKSLSFPLAIMQKQNVKKKYPINASFIHFDAIFKMAAFYPCTFPPATVIYNVFTQKQCVRMPPFINNFIYYFFYHFVLNKVIKPLGRTGFKSVKEYEEETL